jgi:hypothetical protein
LVQVLDALFDREVIARVFLLVFVEADCVVEEEFEISDSLSGRTSAIKACFKTLKCVFRCVEIALVAGSKGAEETGYVLRCLRRS